ncbi:reverse transcriptase domain-containing protein [Methylobacter sp. sgz302048]|uniref:reverse transcriptase domain-containing protein n=1 Tax=Methylobacter sp. sgz302048 TaxID=3455945 RepID=UPI003F9F8D91
MLDKKRRFPISNLSPHFSKLKTYLSLQQAFDFAFHHKFTFNDFINLNVEQECQRLGPKIFSPSPKLKKYHRFLNKYIFDYAKINENVVYSYRQDKSSFGAVIKHAENKYFFQTDIKDFFNSINADDVEIVIDKNLNGTSISDIQYYKNQLLRLTTIHGRLPIGFATSPNISNSCLLFFDNELEAFCIEQGITYTRYSDDIILSSNDKNILEPARDFIVHKLKLLYGERIVINSKKTKFSHKGGKIKLLGLVILPSGKVSVDMKMKSQLEILLHFYINDRERYADYLKNNYDGDPTKISGQLNYINAIDSSYLDKLRKKYGNFIVDIFYHQAIK